MMCIAGVARAAKAPLLVELWHAPGSCSDWRLTYVLMYIMLRREGAPRAFRFGAWASLSGEGRPQQASSTEVPLSDYSGERRV
jgi:hypothetical protein